MVKPCTVEKVLYLQGQGFHVVDIWECDIRRELEQDAGMKTYFDNYDLSNPLEPRDAFFGGRTIEVNITGTLSQGGKLKLCSKLFL